MLTIDTESGYVTAHCWTSAVNWTRALSTLSLTAVSSPPGDCATRLLQHAKAHDLIGGDCSFGSHNGSHNFEKGNDWLLRVLRPRYDRILRALCSYGRGLG